MPFTLAHPAAVVPFRRLVGVGRLPLDAFVLGTMVPDFEYLLRLEPFAMVSHSWRGLVVFCLPVGALTLACWVMLLRTPTRALLALPANAHSTSHNAGWWLRAIVALSLGSATHIVWDAFTHRDAWGPELLPVLRTTALTVGSWPVPWYNVLQVASSLAGGAVVCVWCTRYLRAQGAWPAVLRTRWRQRTWLALLACALVGGGWNATRHGIMSDPSRTKIVLGRVVVGSMSAFCVALAGYALLMRRQKPGASYM